MNVSDVQAPTFLSSERLNEFMYILRCTGKTGRPKMMIESRGAISIDPPLLAVVKVRKVFLQQSRL